MEDLKKPPKLFFLFTIMYIALLWDYKEKLNTVSQTVIWRMSHKINYISNSAFFFQNEKVWLYPKYIKKLIKF